ncbi:hypothetical protein ACFQVA_38255 [Actinomadura keratinilytica]
MHWAEINATVGQLVVGYEQDGLDLDDLLALVERLETEHGTDADDFPGGLAAPPYDTAPAALAKMSLVSDCVGIVFAAARGLKPLTMLPLPVVVTESQPRLRRLLENRLGRHQAETAISLAGAAAHALAHGVAPLALDACQRLSQLAEFRGRQEVWARREHELVGDGEQMPAHLTPVPPGPYRCRTGRWRSTRSGSRRPACSAPGRCWPGPGTPPSRRRRCWRRRPRRPGWGGVVLRPARARPGRRGGGAAGRLHPAGAGPGDGGGDRLRRAVRDPAAADVGAGGRGDRGGRGVGRGPGGGRRPHPAGAGRARTVGARRLAAPAARPRHHRQLRAGRARGAAAGGLRPRGPVVGRGGRRGRTRPARRGGGDGGAGGGTRLHLTAHAATGELLPGPTPCSARTPASPRR